MQLVVNRDKVEKTRLGIKIFDTSWRCINILHFFCRHQAVFNPSRRGSIVATTKNVILIDVVALLMIVPYSVHLEVGSEATHDRALLCSSWGRLRLCSTHLAKSIIKGGVQWVTREVCSSLNTKHLKRDVAKGILFSVVEVAILYGAWNISPTEKQNIIVFKANSCPCCSAQYFWTSH